MTGHRHPHTPPFQITPSFPDAARDTCKSDADELVSVDNLLADSEHESLLALLRGPSHSMTQLWTRVGSLAPHVHTLLLTGEHGCGAEIVARLLHSLSPNRRGPFVSLDPVSIRLHLRSPKRLLRDVTGGVLFIDDVNRLPAKTQGDLVRLLRLNRLNPCTVIAFASQDLEALSARGTFSPHLAEALGNVSLGVPALRERAEDLPLLMEALLREAYASAGVPAPTISSCFRDQALQFDWPGNLSQLRSMMCLLASSAHSSTLKVADFLTALTRLRHSEVDEQGLARLVKLDVVVQEHIRSVMIACHGNKVRASEVLGISRSTLYRILESKALHSRALVF